MGAAVAAAAGVALVAATGAAVAAAAGVALVAATGAAVAPATGAAVAAATGAVAPGTVLAAAAVCFSMVVGSAAHASAPAPPPPSQGSSARATTGRSAANGDGGMFGSGGTLGGDVTLGRQPGDLRAVARLRVAHTDALLLELSLGSAPRVSSSAPYGALSDGSLLCGDGVSGGESGEASFLCGRVFSLGDGALGHPELTLSGGDLSEGSSCALRSCVISKPRAAAGG
jgi:hypothetical protein